MPSSDNRMTPSWITDRFTCVLDPAGHPASTVNAWFTLTEEEDGLAQDWTTLVGGATCDERDIDLFLNPPFSRAMPWVKKFTEMRRAGFTVMGLFKHDPSTRWWEALVGDNWWYIGEFRGRLSFPVPVRVDIVRETAQGVTFTESDWALNEDGKANFPCVLVTNWSQAQHRFPRLRWYTVYNEAI